MTTRAVVVAAAAVLLVFVGCNGPSTSTDTPAGLAAASTTPVPVDAPAALPGSFVTREGAVDYPALRRRYGAPNENIVLNPRSFDVAKAPGRNTVSVLPDRLEFDTSEAPWVVRRAPGDTFYCSTGDCNGSAFIRNVTGIFRKGTKTVVLTTQGRITDVVFYGWYHFEGPVQLQLPKGIEHDGLGTTTAEGKLDLGGGSSLKGTIETTPTFTFTGSGDLVVDCLPFGCYSWSKGYTAPSLSLFKLSIGAGAALDVKVTLEAKQQDKYKKEIFKKSWPLAPIVIGVVPVVPTFELEADGTASVSAKTTITADVNGGVDITAGIAYTRAGGWQPSGSATPKLTSSLDVKGKVTAKAGVSLTAGMAFKIVDVAGPKIDLTAEAGIEVFIDSTPCTGFQGDAYFTLEGSIGVEFCIPVVDICTPDKDSNLKLSYKFPWSIDYKFPKPPYKFPLSADEAAQCSTDAGMPSDASVGGADAGCPGSQTQCANGCTDTQTDNANCGQCGNKCVDSAQDMNSSCSAGKCSCKCSDGTACPGANTSTCTNGCVCADNSACPGGDKAKCPCASGKKDCGQGCQDVNSDSNNCGDCGVVCAGSTGDSASTCSNATCSCKCSDGTACPGSSKDNCASADCKCSDGTACPGGLSSACPCPAGKKDCGYGFGCQDVNSDPLNCGSCGNACASTGDKNSTCTAGVCSCKCDDGSACTGGTTAKCACPAGTTSCADGCADLQTAPKDCGKCGNSCWTVTGDPAASCTAGSCACKCPTGEACPDGKTSASCCKCSDGTTCPGGDPTQCCSGNGTTNCGNQGCVNLMTDTNNCGQCFNECGVYTKVSDSVCDGSGHCTCKCPGTNTDCPGGIWTPSGCPD